MKQCPGQLDLDFTAPPEAAAPEPDEDEPEEQEDEDREPAFGEEDGRDMLGYDVWPEGTAHHDSWLQLCQDIRDHKPFRPALERYYRRIEHWYAEQGSLDPGEEWEKEWEARRKSRI